MHAYEFPETQFNQLIERLSNQWLNEKLAHKDAISGEEILRFAPHAQVNRFVLFQVNQDLNTFVQGLNHPHFNWSHPEIREAIEGFQNVLSRHIRLEKPAFAELLKKALYNTLKLLLEPEATFERFFFRKQQRVPVGSFKRFAHYFANFDFLLQGVLAYHEKQGLGIIEHDVFLEKIARLEQLYEKKRGTSLDDYRAAMFLELTGQELKRFTTGRHHYASVTVTPDPTRTTATAPKKTGEVPTAKPPVSVDIPAPSVPEISAPPPPKPELKPTTTPPQTQPTVRQVAPTLPPPANVPHTDTGRENAKAPSLADKLGAERPSLNQQLGGQHLRLSVDRIPLHKQFQFINKIFDGNSQLFRKTLAALNEQPHWPAAQEYLDTHLLNMPQVDREDKVTLEFVQLVQNAF